MLTKHEDDAWEPLVSEPHTGNTLISLTVVDLTVLHGTGGWGGSTIKVSQAERHEAAAGLFSVLICHCSVGWPVSITRPRQERDPSKVFLRARPISSALTLSQPLRESQACPHAVVGCGLSRECALLLTSVCIFPGSPYSSTRQTARNSNSALPRSLWQEETQPGRSHPAKRDDNL